jgi:iron complex transport system ATP-binding protein
MKADFKDVLLKIDAADFGFDNSGVKKVLLHDTSLEIRKGELVCLIGKNGSGKTTLLKTLMRLHPVLKGRIRMNDRDIFNYKPAEFAQLAAYVSTDIVKADQMSLRELVELGRFPYTNWIGRMNVEDKSSVDNAIKWVGLSDMQDAKISLLSDGERQRAMIARTLSQDTEFLLLDEPSAFLDIPNKYEVSSLLRRLCMEGKTILFSTHDLNLALQFSHKIWLIENNSVIEGAPEDLVLAGKIEKIFSSVNISFNKSTADFEPVSLDRQKITFAAGEGDELVAGWTSKALKRAGYEIVSEKHENIPDLKIFREKDHNIWKLHKDNKNLLFESLYELIYYLTNS